MSTTDENFCNTNMMNVKREKFRVEIRKSHQKQDLENKRFLVLKKNALEGKENVIFDIFSKEIAIKPNEIFKFFENNLENCDEEKLIQYFQVLDHYVDVWDESFKKEFLKNHIVEKILCHIFKVTNKKILALSCSIFFGLSTENCFRDLKGFYEDLIKFYQYMLSHGTFETETIINMVYGMANICFDSKEVCLRILEGVLLEKIQIIYEKATQKKLLNKPVSYLLVNILENIQIPLDIKTNEVRALVDLNRVLFEDFDLVVKNPTNKENASLLTYALSLLTKKFNPLLIFEILEQNSVFFLDLLTIIDNFPINDYEFLCPLLDFFSDLIGIPYIDPNEFFKIGLLETIDFLLKEPSHEKVKKTALEILNSIPFESNPSSNYEGEIFSFLQKRFKEIILGHNTIVKKQLIATLNTILENGDLTDQKIINFFNDKEILHKFLELFEEDDIKMQENALELIENILIIGVNEMAHLSLSTNPLALKIFQDDLFKNIEALQASKNEKIAEIANKLYDSYFENM